MSRCAGAPPGRPNPHGFTSRPEYGPPGYPSLSFSTARASDVVVGLGNEIARDDGVGIAAAREIERRIAGRPADSRDVEVVPLPWAGFALLDVLAGRRRAALIDCLVTGEQPPGTIVRLDEGDVRGSVRLNSFHDIAFPTALALGRDLGWTMPEEIAIWAVEAAVVDRFGEGLSAPVAAAVGRVVDEVLAFLSLPPSRPHGATPHSRPHGATPHSRPPRGDATLAPRSDATLAPLRGDP